MTVKREVIFAVFFGFFVAMIIYGASQTLLYWPFLKIQNRIDDSNFSLRNAIGDSKYTASDSIVIVDVDDATIKALGRINSKRWPRRHMAKAIGALNGDGARLIFLDIIFEGRTRDSAMLADSIRAANVVAGYYFKLEAESRKRRPRDSVYNDIFSNFTSKRNNKDEPLFIRANDVVFPNDSIVRTVKALGFTNYIPDPDGVLRHIPLYISHGRAYSRASASAALQMFLFIKKIGYKQADISSKGVRFGDTFIVTDSQSFLRLNFRDAGASFRYVSFLDVLNGSFPPGTFKDKIVMIGSSSEKAGDTKRVPGHRSLPGVEVHATALSTLLEGDFLRVMPGGHVFILAVVLGILSSLVFSFSRPFLVSLPVAAAVPLLLYAAGAYAFIAHGYLVNSTVPSFTVMFMYVVIMAHRLLEYYEEHHVKKETGENIRESAVQ